MTEAQIREIVRSELIKACWSGEIRNEGGFGNGTSYSIRPVGSPFMITFAQGETAKHCFGPEIILPLRKRRRTWLIVMLCRLFGL